jgi:hypothetical protein
VGQTKMEVSEARSILGKYLHKGEEILREIKQHWDDVDTLFIAFLTGDLHGPLDRWNSGVKNSLSNGIGQLTKDDYVTISEWSNMGSLQCNSIHKIVDTGAKRVGEILISSLHERLDWLRELRDNLQDAAPLGSVYVPQEVISDLEKMNIENIKWDFSKVIQICIELNSGWQNKSYLSVIFLVRSLMDHVPPLWIQDPEPGKINFDAVCGQVGGSSFKSAMQNLRKQHKHIADRLLHEHIARRVSLPPPELADSRKEVIQLLQKIVEDFG